VLALFFPGVKISSRALAKRDTQTQARHHNTLLLVQRATARCMARLPFFHQYQTLGPFTTSNLNLRNKIMAEMLQVCWEACFRLGCFSVAAAFMWRRIICILVLIFYSGRRKTVRKFRVFEFQGVGCIRMHRTKVTYLYFSRY
jgi:hypothetical protein